jgi:hypothetical protein
MPLLDLLYSHQTNNSNEKLSVSQKKWNSTPIGDNVSIFFLSSPIQLTTNTNISRITSQHTSPPDLVGQLAQFFCSFFLLLFFCPKIPSGMVGKPKLPPTDQSL